MEEMTRFDIIAIITIALIIISSLTWIFTFINQRRKLNIRIIHYFPIDNKHFFYVSIKNLSRLPILISQMYLLLTEHEGKIECKVSPKKVIKIERKKGTRLISGKTLESLEMPIHLSTLGGFSGYVAFEVSEKSYSALSNFALFRIHTSRGRAFKKYLSLNCIVNSEEMIKYHID